MDIQDVKSRLLKRCDVDAATGCWNWTGALNSMGYGQIRVDHKSLYVHRLSAELLGGLDVAGKDVCHRCDNPRCFSPEHLWCGTHAENMRDCWIKGRTARGEKLSQMRRGRGWKLSEDQARTIYNDSRPSRTVAADYGISKTMVLLIKKGRTWTHIGGTDPLG